MTQGMTLGRAPGHTLGQPHKNGPCHQPGQGPFFSFLDNSPSNTQNSHYKTLKIADKYGIL